MSDFDPVKEAINLSKHGISLARWVDLEISTIVPDDRFDYGERAIAPTDCWMGCRIVSFLRYVTKHTGRLVYGVLMPRS